MKNITKEGIKKPTIMDDEISKKSKVGLKIKYNKTEYINNILDT